MASNNWTNPTLAGTHVNVLSELKGRDVDALKMIDDETPTNLPEKAKKWDDSLKVFRTYLSTVWTTLVLAVAGGGTGSATAAGARTNLSVDSSAEVDGKVATHQALTNPHSSTPDATPSRLVLRDAAGRAKVVAPSVEGDIALKSNVTTVQGNLDTHAALANPHGACFQPTVSKIILRDAAGRAQVEDPSADKDLVNKQYLVASLSPFAPLTNFVSVKKAFGGDGSDGDVVISSNTTLADSGIGVKVMQYNNLTVNTGIYLEGHANDKVLVILVKGTLTLNGTIRMNGRGGIGGTGNISDGGDAGAFGGGGGGGATGLALGGGGGGFGQAGQVEGLGGGRNESTYPWVPTLPFASFCGRGGNGGNVAVGTVGINLMNALLVALPFETVRYLYGAGGGEGTGGFDGGDGGQGGGVIWIEANAIIWGGAGIVSVNGVNGSAGGAAKGGGGGGAGGFAQIVFLTKTGASTIQATGGTAGAGGGGGGFAGGAGVAGSTGEFQVE